MWLDIANGIKDLPEAGSSLLLILFHPSPVIEAFRPGGHSSETHQHAFGREPTCTGWCNGTVLLSSCMCLSVTCQYEARITVAAESATGYAAGSNIAICCESYPRVRAKHDNVHDFVMDHLPCCWLKKSEMYRNEHDTCPISSASVAVHVWVSEAGQLLQAALGGSTLDKGLNLWAAAYWTREVMHFFIWAAVDSVAHVEISGVQPQNFTRLPATSWYSTDALMWHCSIRWPDHTWSIMMLDPPISNECAQKSYASVAVHYILTYSNCASRCPDSSVVRLLAACLNPQRVAGGEKQLSCHLSSH